jgi:hypothetical protein
MAELSSRGRCLHLLGSMPGPSSAQTLSLLHKTWITVIPAHIARETGAMHQGLQLCGKAGDGEDGQTGGDLDSRRLRDRDGLR